MPDEQTLLPPEGEPEKPKRKRGRPRKKPTEIDAENQAVLERSGAMPEKIPPSRDPSVLGLMESVIARSKDANATEIVAAIRDLSSLYVQEEKRRAEQEYNAALASVQAECPTVMHNKKADILSRKGGKFSYGFTSLDFLMDSIRPVLDKHGLSVTWYTDTDDNGNIRGVGCEVRHRAGHKERGAIVPAKVDPSAVVNDNQKVGIAISYAKRYAVMNALGITTGERDTDGHIPEAPEQSDTISDDQVADLAKRIAKLGVDQEKFLAYLKSIDPGISSLEDLKRKHFGKVMQKLDEKGRKG